MKTIRIRESGFIPLPSDNYRLRVTAITEVRWEGRDALEWTFQVIRGPYAGCFVKGMTNLPDSMKSNQKLGRWYHALTGLWWRAGDEVDVEDLVRQLTGKICSARIELTRSRSGKPANNVELLAEEGEDDDLAF